MKPVFHLIFSFFSNLIALWAAAFFVKGFNISFDVYAFLMTVGAFTVINVFIRPIFKFFFGPVIILTFGLGIILVNAMMLYFLDSFSASINIVGIKPLLYATLIITIVNFIIAFSARRAYKT